MADDDDDNEITRFVRRPGPAQLPINLGRGPGTIPAAGPDATVVPPPLSTGGANDSAPPVAPPGAFDRPRPVMTPPPPRPSTPSFGAAPLPPLPPGTPAPTPAPVVLRPTPTPLAGQGTRMASPLPDPFPAVRPTPAPIPTPAPEPVVPSRAEDAWASPTPAPAPAPLPRPAPIRLEARPAPTPATPSPAIVAATPVIAPAPVAPIAAAAPAPVVPVAVVEPPKPGPVDPVVGWLVIVKGPGRGVSREIVAGRNGIGSAAGQAVLLDFGDPAIAPQGHAYVVYDDEAREFFVEDGKQKIVARLNGRLLTETMQIRNGDELRIGATTLRFVALCGPDFDWTEKQEKDADVWKPVDVPEAAAPVEPEEVAPIIKTPPVAATPFEAHVAAKPAEMEETVVSLEKVEKSEEPAGSSFKDEHSSKEKEPEEPHLKAPFSSPSSIDW